MPHAARMRIKTKAIEWNQATDRIMVKNSGRAEKDIGKNTKRMFHSCLGHFSLSRMYRIESIYRQNGPRGTKVVDKRDRTLGKPARWPLLVF